ncbi:hypothetical protein Tco_1548061 [Tanacetum coccineum]
MSSITTQQTKLDLELVPKENRLDIEKCNGRIPHGLTPREPTFQVVLDAIALTPCYPAFFITVDVPEICPRVPGRDFDPLPSEEDTVSFLRELGHTGEINSLNDVVVDQMHQPWRTFAALINRGLSGKTSGLDKLRLSRAQILWGMFYQKNVDYVELLWEDFIYQIENRVYKKQEKIPAMKESKAYKTYLGYATGAVPPKMAQIFKKASPSKKDTGVVIREAPVETKSKSKEKENLDVTREKGIELLSEVALTEEAQMKKVRKKSLRDFHKTHPSSSGTVAKKPPSVDKITPTVTSEGTGNDEDDNNNDQDSSNEDSEQENESKEQVSDSKQEEEYEDNDQEKEFVQTPSPTDDKDDDNLESKSVYVNKSDEESDDVIKGNKEIVQGEGADAEMIDAQQGNENLKTTQEQVVEYAHVTISTVTKKTEVPVTSFSRSSDLASKFLNFSNIPHTDVEIVSPLDVHDLDKDFFFSYDVYSLKRGRKDKDKDEDPSAGSDQGLKKRKTSKDVEPTTDSDMPQDQEGNLGDNDDEPRKETASRCDWFKKSTPPQEPTDLDWHVGKTTQKGSTQKWLMTPVASTLTDKSLKDFDELMSTPINFSSYILNGLKIENLTQEILLRPAFRLLKGTISNHAELEYDFEECYKALSEKLDWENPEGGDYPFDLSKPLPLIKHGKRQRVPFEYFINNDLKYLQGGVSTMTYTMFTTKSKAAQYALWGISHWREQHKSFYAYARGIQSRGDVYSTKRILPVTHVKVMRKHGYEYLEEIVVRRADNVLYRFKEGDDVADFAIILRMFTRNLVIQKRVEDLQLGVESYQKKINVTNPDTTRPYLRKRHPYTPYKDPQGFIYVDDYKRNRLMRSDELYKFSDGTLTRLLSSLEDITKNINMEYLPKRRWSTLEKKRVIS